MPIPVTCPECQYHCLVDDEFAGRPGRCPECAAIIHVPGPDTFAAASDDPYPLQTPRAVEAFEEFPTRSRRREEWDRRDVEPDRPRSRDRAAEKRFDPHARAAAWERVRRGLGYLQVSVVLGFLSQIMQTILIAARGGDQGNPNNLDSGLIAAALGGLVLFLAASGFWCLGRLAMVRVPYVPARGWARVGFFMAIAAVVTLMAFVFLLFLAVAVVAQQGPNAGAVAFLLIAVMALLLGAVLMVGAEMSGLVSMAKIGDGLKATEAASWARRSLVLLAGVLGLLIVGFCGLTIYAGEQKKERQKEKAANPPAVGKEDPAAKPDPKEKNNVPAKGKAAAPNGAGPPPPNPFDDDPPLDEETQLLANAIMWGIVLIYLIHYSIALQKGRRAIRAEVRRLNGTDRHDEHDPH